MPPGWTGLSNVSSYKLMNHNAHASTCEAFAVIGTMEDMRHLGDCVAGLTICIQLKHAVGRPLCNPRRSMIPPIPLWSTVVFPHFVTDVQDAAQDRIDLAPSPTVLGSELAGKALAVPEAPVDDQPGQSLAVDGPTPRSPDESGCRHVMPSSVVISWSMMLVVWKCSAARDRTYRRSIA